jgi:hypothetical protein
LALAALIVGHHFAISAFCHAPLSTAQALKFHIRTTARRDAGNSLGSIRLILRGFVALK